MQKTINILIQHWIQLVPLLKSTEHASQLHLIENTFDKNSLSNLLSKLIGISSLWLTQCLYSSTMSLIHKTMWYSWDIILHILSHQNSSSWCVFPIVKQPCKAATHSPMCILHQINFWYMHHSQTSYVLLLTHRLFLSNTFTNVHTPPKNELETLF